MREPEINKVLVYLLSFRFFFSLEKYLHTVVLDFRFGLTKNKSSHTMIIMLTTLISLKNCFLQNKIQDSGFER